eukprot:CAMPEP_0178956958 /NCGR_PEP_ID=MMETSP0789-20121207/10601_1 /TAXON_ID=3005 /ORGANISM="Rhizosolenia setigera, Strain CCMP 1694" /LENGTH=403 /DNA_ID=CAMNT_0020639061 /DNA_START=238 /DNA_END=1449 /DNA_ORIENTATION=-
MKGQLKLKNSKVLVVGAGGLGSPCLMYLAAAGVGHIGIVDADTVDESNLQRQIIHSTSTINISKCKSAKERILEINPNTKVTLFEKEFTSSTALEIIKSSESDWDVVIDGSDNFPTKYLINDVCEIVGVPWVYSAILAFEGQLSVFNYKGGPTYRDMMPEPPPPGDVPSCAEGGVLGVLPGVMGVLQATEAIKIILNEEPEKEMSDEGEEGVLSGRVLVYDALKMKFSEIGLQRIPEDERVKITELIDYQGFCAGPKVTPPTPPPVKGEGKVDDISGGRTMDEAEQDINMDESEQKSFNSVTPSECLEKLMNGWAPYVLDVRLQTENDIVQLPFTDKVSPHRNVSPKDIPKEGEVLVYCKAGVRGKKACKRLIDLGVESDRLYNLDGGIMRWKRDLDPSMPKY